MKGDKRLNGALYSEQSDIEELFLMLNEIEEEDIVIEFTHVQDDQYENLLYGTYIYTVMTERTLYVRPKYPVYIENHNTRKT